MDYGNRNEGMVGGKKNFGSLDFICIELINGVMIYRHDYLFRDLFGLSSVLCLRLDPVDD